MSHLWFKDGAGPDCSIGRHSKQTSAAVRVAHICVNTSTLKCFHVGILNGVTALMWRETQALCEWRYNKETVAPGEAMKLRGCLDHELRLLIRSYQQPEGRQLLGLDCVPEALLLLTRFSSSCMCSTEELLLAAEHDVLNCKTHCSSVTTQSLCLCWPLQLHRGDELKMGADLRFKDKIKVSKSWGYFCNHSYNYCQYPYTTIKMQHVSMGKGRYFFFDFSLLAFIQHALYWCILMYEHTAM